MVPHAPGHRIGVSDAARSTIRLVLTEIPGHDSLEASLSEGDRQNEQSGALRLSHLLQGRLIQEARFNDSVVLFHLDDGTCIDVRAHLDRMTFGIGELGVLPPSSLADDVQVSGGTEDHLWNRRTLLGRRNSKRIRNLRFADTALFLYVEACPILLFMRARCADTGAPILTWGDTD